MEIPLEEVKDDWMTEAGNAHIKAAAEHYGIYEDLFEGAYFYPVRRLTVGYALDEEYVTPVYRGNRIPASEVSSFRVNEEVLYDFCKKF